MHADVLAKMRERGLISSDTSDEEFIGKLLADRAERGGKDDVVVSIVEYSKLNSVVRSMRFAVGAHTSYEQVLRLVAKEYPRALRLVVTFVGTRFVLYPRTGEVFRSGHKEPYMRVPPSELAHLSKYNSWLKEHPGVIR